MGTLRFTQKRLEELQCPPGKPNIYVHDADTKGLTLYVSQSGVKSFYLYKRIGGKPTRLKLGRWPDELSIDDARREAVKASGEVAKGNNPHRDRLTARRETTLGELWTIHLEHARQHNRPSSVAENESQYRTHLERWAGRRLSEITRADVERLHRSIGEKSGKYAANRMLALLSHMYRVTATRIGFAGPNPCAGIEKFKERSRDRYLTSEELPKFFAALDQEPEIFRDLFRMALLTGARRSNLQAMAWVDVDLSRKVWSIPADDAKAGEPIHVPIVGEAAEILTRRRNADPNGEYVFPSRGATGHIVEIKSSWDRITKRAGITGLRPHDLRRSTGSWLAAAGVSLPIIGKLLGHRNASTTQVYARLALDPVREGVLAGTSAMMAAARAKPTEGGTQ